jgi:cobaltochelatase CobN
VPVDVYTREWLGRKIRNQVHLTKGGCLGPCALANVVSLVFDGRSIWFHSVNSPWQVRQIFDYIDAMLAADRFLQPPPELSEFVFNYYDWDVRKPSEPVSTSELVKLAPDANGAIMLLSHADTDLLTLIKASEQLPKALRVSAFSLNALRNEEQLSVLIQGEMGKARVIVVRCHGPLSCISGFDRLRAACMERGQSLVLVSGCGENSSEFSETINVPADVMQSADAYLTLGGVQNFAELFRFLSDRLMLTGYGYAPPTPMPEHGIYLPEVEEATLADWERQADFSRPIVAVLFYRAHRMSGNTGFIDCLAQALEAKGVNALCIFTSSLKAKENGQPAAFQFMEGRADVLITTLSFALGDVNTGSVTQPVPALSSFERLGIPVVQAIAMPDAARRMGGFAPWLQRSGHSSQRRHPRVRWTYHRGTNLVQRTRQPWCGESLRTGSDDHSRCPERAARNCRSNILLIVHDIRKASNVFYGEVCLFPKCSRSRGRDHKVNFNITHCA